MESDKLKMVLEKMSDLADLDDDFNEYISEFLNMTNGEYIKHQINKLIEQYRAMSDVELNTKIVDSIKREMKT